MDRLFTDRVALVTGAAGAIGKGIAADFCRRGAKAFITDLAQAGVDAAVKEVTAAGVNPQPWPLSPRGCGTAGLSSRGEGRRCSPRLDKPAVPHRNDEASETEGLPAGGSCAGLAADVVSARQVAAVVEAARTFGGGRIDYLVNVAGVVGQGKVEDLTEEEWDRVFAVNCKGTFLFIKYVVPHMKARKFGKIINFSSKSGKTGSALMCHYSAAKAAIIGLTQALACELAGDGITVNCLCPGITENTGVWSHVSAGYIQNLALPRDEVVRKFTAKVPLGRLASIEDIVAVTRFLASDGADYMTGQAINVTGGREMH